MADLVTSTSPAPPAFPAGGAGYARTKRKRRHYSLLTRRDRFVLLVMVCVPLIVELSLIWFPTVASVILSFTRWNGIGGLSSIQFIGLQNYATLFSSYPAFWPAVLHNVIWLAFFILVAAPLGILFAVLLDRDLRGSRIYQSVLFLPVVLSLAVVGLMWDLIYSPDQGLLNNLLGTTSSSSHFIDWLGDPSLNLWAVLIAATWREVGYIMILYLAGLKSLDPSLREAAAIDGANEWQTFVWVVFPVLKPINIIILVVTVIDSLRAFDIVYIVNRGMNGLELLSVLIANNIIGEGSRIGFGSAIAVVLLVVSVVPIITFLAWSLSEERR
jgi:ABC-type sugar transport system permease subunit